MNGVRLSFKDNALQAIVKRALEKKTGARGLRSIIENLLLETMFTIPDNKFAREIVIDEDVVNGNARPLIVEAQENVA